MSEFDHQDGVSRRKVLECMTWCGTGVFGQFGRRAALARHHGRGAGGRHARPYFPADQRQPRRVRQAGQSQRARHLEEAIDKVNALPRSPPS